MVFRGSINFARLRDAASHARVYSPPSGGPDERCQGWVRRLADELPEDATWDDVMERINETIVQAEGLEAV